MVLPGISRIFADFLEMRSLPLDAPVRKLYGGDPYQAAWMHRTLAALQPRREDLVTALRAQNESWGAGPETLAQLKRLQEGARAVVTGQQVGLFGGPLLTLMKAATAIRKAQMASEAGVPHVPVFWMATEDHDFEEVNQITLLAKGGLETLRLPVTGHRLRPVGNLPLGDGIEPVLARAEEMLGFAPVTEVLRRSYTADETFASGFARWTSEIFREFGLIVIDASTRAFHGMGAPVLRYAIEHAEELQGVLQAQSARLVELGYHAQVLVPENGSLLFLIDEAGERVPLRRTSNGTPEWKAGGRTYSTDDLLAILESKPERLSPNALLRPVFQDAILPTSAYVAGPAEIAYFAQCQPLFERILGSTTPVLPRLSATLVSAEVRALMQRYDIPLETAMQTADGLAQRLGARAMPIEGKQAIASAGEELHNELQTVTAWMHRMDAGLGRSADVAASKMRYQMNRLRRLAANWQLEKDAHLRKHAEAVTLAVFPGAHPQERVLGGVALLVQATGDLPALLVKHADQSCPGHRVLDI